MNRIIKIILVLILCSSSVFAYEQDDLVNSTLLNKELTKPELNLNYNFQSTKRIPIKLQIVTPVKSEKDLYEGQILEFKVINNAKFNNIQIAEIGNTVTAKVETIIANGMNGIPASVILGNFEINGIKQSQISTNYEKYGFDLSLLVFPLKWALTPFPPTGSLTNFIKGGHARISTRDNITVHYYPEWN